MVVAVKRFVRATRNPRTWAEIKSAVDESVATRLWQVGDLTQFVNFQGTMGGTTWNERFNFRIVEMTDSEIWFYQAQNENGVEIALVDEQYNKVISVDQPGLCMNPYKDDVSSNVGGYEASYGNKTLMYQYERCLPNDLRTVIKAMPIWADNAGNEDSSASAITSFTATVFLASQVQITGDTNYINTNMANHYTQWTWYKNGNSYGAYSSRNTSALTRFWLTEPQVNTTVSFRLINNTGTNSYSNWAADSRGIRAGFRIAK